MRQALDLVDVIETAGRGSSEMVEFFTVLMPSFASQLTEAQTVGRLPNYVSNHLYSYHLVCGYPHSSKTGCSILLKKNYWCWYVVFLITDLLLADDVLFLKFG